MGARRAIPLLLAALTALAALGVPVGTPATAADRARSTSAPAQPERDLGDDFDARQLAPARAAQGAVPTWARGRITYAEKIPAKWQWGLDRAIETWNQAGAKVRFVKARSWRSAQVRISYGDTWGADGLGGYTSRGNRIFKGFVHLATSYRTANENDDQIRVWVGILFAHELGHVLGFQHTSQQCSLMAPIFYFGTCGPLSEDKVGYYRCQWIDKPLLRNFIRRYGGKPHRPPKDCPVYPLPNQLKDVGFSGGGTGDPDTGGGSPVTITWAKPGRTAKGTKVRISTWAATACGKEPASARAVLLDPASRRWSDGRAGDGTACYRVQVVNRSGAGPAPLQRVMRRYAPTPDTPAATARWLPEEGAFELRWTPPDGVVLLAQLGEGWDGSCPDPLDPAKADELWQEHPGRYRAYPAASDSCVALYASNGVRSSAPQVLHLVVPPPTATPTVGQVGYDEDAGGWVVHATLATDDPGVRLGIEVVPGSCPATAPADADFWDFYELGDDRYYLWGDEGPNCALVAAVDGYGGHGPVVARPFTVSWD